jgi:polyisoprenoid-binding protein YceI
MHKGHCNLTRTAVVVLLGGCILSARAQDLVLRLDPAGTRADFKLDATGHSVEGSFALERGELRFDPASGKVNGEIVFDARSGHSGNDRRDRKMHKDVLQSEQYPEITYRPDKVEGTLALQGSSRAQVHGVFRIHGSDHELSATVQIDAFPQKWTGTAQFVVPYVQWGMKNPSVLLLRVGTSVDLDLHFTATVSRPQ